MSISPRIEYLTYAAVCVVNALAMMLLFFGHAATGSGIKPLLWPEALLCILGVLLLAAFNGARAKQVDQPGWTAGIATLLLLGLGPAVLLLVIYLAALPEKGVPGQIGRQAPPMIIGLQAAALLLLPWLLLWGMRSIWSPA